MSTSDFTTNPVFLDKDKARKHLESIRWPTGPVCPHCEGKDVYLLGGKSHRPGLYRCRSCRKQFTVTVGTVFERSHIPLNKWLLATHLLTSSKKGISTHQLHRLLGVTYRSAWFMAHRLREAMRETVSPPMLGGKGAIVEADETYWGRKPGWKKFRGMAHKEAILTLVERDGRARSFHVPHVNGKTLQPILTEQLKQDSHLMTDEGGQYSKIGPMYLSHETVNHGIKEYSRGNISTNTVEGYFSILKRGLTGVYQHVSAKHLKRYLGEFDFRYSYRVKLGYSDADRAIEALKGIEGKRLTYRRTSQGQ